MALLSDHRRGLFAVKVNDLITEKYKLEAELDKVAPDPDFKIERSECDLKDHRPYENLLCGKTMRRKDLVKENIVQILHEDPVLSDFLKYLDQLSVDKKKKEVDVDKKNKLQKRVNIAFDLLKEFMNQVCIFGLDEIFNQKIQLFKAALKGKRGQRLSTYFGKIKKQSESRLNANLVKSLLMSKFGIEFEQTPVSVEDRTHRHGLKIHRGND